MCPCSQCSVVGVGNSSICLIKDQLQTKRNGIIDYTIPLPCRDEEVAAGRAVQSLLFIRVFSLHGFGSTLLRKIINFKKMFYLQHGIRYMRFLGACKRKLTYKPKTKKQNKRSRVNPTCTIEPSTHIQGCCDIGEVRGVTSTACGSLPAFLLSLLCLQCAHLLLHVLFLCSLDIDTVSNCTVTIIRVHLPLM